MKKAKYTCKHCKHSWVARKAKPKRCPHCRRSDWMPENVLPYHDRFTDNSVFPGLQTEKKEVLANVGQGIHNSVNPDDDLNTALGLITKHDVN